MVAAAGQRLGIVADRQQQQVDGHRLALGRIVGGVQPGQQQQVVEQALHARGLLLHLL
ncbi:hypothetical protein D9M73_218210 [compost metagenome]